MQTNEIKPGHRWKEGHHDFMLAMVDSEILDFPYVVVNLTSGLVEQEHYSCVEEFIDTRLPDADI